MLLKIIQVAVWQGELFGAKQGGAVQVPLGAARPVLFLGPARPVLRPVLVQFRLLGVVRPDKTALQ